MKLTPELIDLAADLCRRFPYEDTICDFLGISRMSWWRWKRRGKELQGRDPAKLTENDRLCRQFCYVIQKARAEMEMGLFEELRPGSEGWQAQAWSLERAFRDHWRRTEIVEHRVRDKARELAADEGLDDNELLREAERIATEAFG